MGFKAGILMAVGTQLSGLGPANGATKAAKRSKDNVNKTSKVKTEAQMFGMVIVRQKNDVYQSSKKMTRKLLSDVTKIPNANKTSAKTRTIWKRLLIRRVAFMGEYTCVIKAWVLHFCYPNKNLATFLRKNSTESKVTRKNTPTILKSRDRLDKDTKREIYS
uniref:Uncharacterized protein n=1 Tax=Romanomermis culicivorax TaxID=13658 RepID=A0A915JXT1_ROMCU